MIILALALLSLAPPVFAAPTDAGGAAQAAASGPGLFVQYTAKDSCTVYLNYPKDGVTANSTFTIPAGHTLIWRYNVNADWAVVSYSARAHKIFPWWGFTRRECIGVSVKQGGYPAGRAIPDRIREGRSNQTTSGWRPVSFTIPAAAIVQPDLAVRRDATLRDDVNFVIGNVQAGWHVDVSARTRSNGHWVKVYVPHARRWGYVERSVLG
ncbi:hypothetical protein [Actinocrispum sp. NPDC049592]|uniref:hypothetical protein n=1 Tax=Actinocrispum sp. NPDC049592 TaxID=3154835 RepID=UPI00343BC3CF